MSIKYCILVPFNLHLLILLFCPNLTFCVSFGILVFCNLLRKSWSFKVKNANFGRRVEK
jgi:hypothetical protein